MSEWEGQHRCNHELTFTTDLGEVACQICGEIIEEDFIEDGFVTNESHKTLGAQYSAKHIPYEAKSYVALILGILKHVSLHDRCVEIANFRLPLDVKDGFHVTKTSLLNWTCALICTELLKHDVFVSPYKILRLIQATSAEVVRYSTMFPTLARFGYYPMVLEIIQRRFEFNLGDDAMDQLSEIQKRLQRLTLFKNCPGSAFVAAVVLYRPDLWSRTALKGVMADLSELSLADIEKHLPSLQATVEKLWMDSATEEVDWGSVPLSVFVQQRTHGATVSDWPPDPRPTRALWDALQGCTANPKPAKLGFWVRACRKSQAVVDEADRTPGLLDRAERYGLDTTTLSRLTESQILREIRSVADRLTKYRPKRRG
ncbi:hypothetical protein J8273_2453 [Carpediemonas membranifera]|uniref:Uncharacterized protein n=1 Tax=Carpediemonas membranifera TaxID=201153 RepID=A0A8J6E3W6_9EUKA|nr:hypothetical protein J8273_2453 [Carpediemonas membranifera]|eukprot:KAG9396101.1 hypothetical protein J8273_2453 [Carpediemonas membranifera]